MNDDVSLTSKLIDSPTFPRWSTSDISKFTQMMQILISIDRRVRKEASYENHMEKGN